ncbi:DNA primase [Salinibacterium sp. dk2585]|uniref:DNA primase n=1 Tax=unclassified Salinibacterium TaxID=2632331 RepID=UPI0011C25285|nr:MULTISPECIES: DNA primase [unclassified Salinibacterium]QEE61379.1 DNA primase [Salinibacterium sp. dk2585]TXK54056.1 DNA primase [Salinibacterium sp. dk5596]
MAGLIRRSDIDEVRARVNIADVVGDYVTLKGAGVGSLKGLCPFHDERSPSFHVRPQVGRYHCFGCGEDGDIFTFLQRMDHVSFSEAVELMAQRIGFELHYEDGGTASKDHGNRARLIAANTAAAEYFTAQLGTPEAEPARRFLGERGFDAAAAARFGVGFAPKSFDALGKHLKGLGFTELELVTSGLVSKNDRGSTYDRFRGRLVWPIRDVTGQTLGFGARRLLDDDQGPKYLNTPETPIYHKSQVLYGLDLAKRDISRGKQVVVVEGYTDVMACHLAGVTTAVATCGTAFGVDHIKVVRRVLGDFETADSTALGEVVFTFDPDEAGQKAASRAFAEEQRFAAQTYVAVAPEGLDPCDLRLKRGDDAVRLLIAGKKPMFEFMVRRTLARFDLDTVEGRVAGLRAAAPIVAGIRDRALSIGYVRTLAGWLGMDPDEVGRAVAAAQRRSQSEQKGSDAPERAPGSQQSAEPVTDAGPSISQLPNDPATRLERDALMALLQAPLEVGRDLASRVSQAAFAHPSLSVVRDGVAAALGMGPAGDSFTEQAWLERVLEEVPAPFRRLVTELAIAPLPEQSGRDLRVYCRGIATSVIDRDLLRQKAELLGRLQRTDATAEPERHAQIQRALVQVEQERRSLRQD